MAVTITDLSNDTGEIYDALDGGTTAASAILARASNFVKLVTGTSVGYDEIVRPLADSMVVNQVVGGIDSVNKTIGSLSVGDKNLPSMRKEFLDEARRAAVLYGVSIDGYKILMRDSEN